MPNPLGVLGGTGGRAGGSKKKKVFRPGGGRKRPVPAKKKTGGPASGAAKGKPSALKEPQVRKPAGSVLGAAQATESEALPGSAQILSPKEGSTVAQIPTLSEPETPPFVTQSQEHEPKSPEPQTQANLTSVSTPYEESTPQAATKLHVAASPILPKTPPRKAVKITSIVSPKPPRRTTPKASPQPISTTKATVKAATLPTVHPHQKATTPQAPTKTQSEPAQKQSTDAPHAPGTATNTLPKPNKKPSQYGTKLSKSASPGASTSSTKSTPPVPPKAEAQAAVAAPIELLGTELETIVTKIATPKQKQFEGPLATQWDHEKEATSSASEDISQAESRSVHHLAIDVAQSQSSEVENLSQKTDIDSADGKVSLSPTKQSAAGLLSPDADTSTAPTSTDRAASKAAATTVRAPDGAGDQASNQVNDQTGPDAAADFPTKTLSNKSAATPRAVKKTKKSMSLLRRRRTPVARRKSPATPSESEKRVSVSDSEPLVIDLDALETNEIAAASEAQETSTSPRSGIEAEIETELAPVPKNKGENARERRKRIAAALKKRQANAASRKKTASAITKPSEDPLSDDPGFVFPVDIDDVVANMEMDNDAPVEREELPGASGTEDATASLTDENGKESLTDEKTKAPRRKKVVASPKKKKLPAATKRKATAAKKKKITKGKKPTAASKAKPGAKTKKRKRPKKIEIGISATASEEQNDEAADGGDTEGEPKKKKKKKKKKKEKKEKEEFVPRTIADFCIPTLFEEPEKKDSKKKKDDEERRNDDNNIEEEKTNEVAGPEVEVVDGEIVIREESLLLDNGNKKTIEEINEELGGEVVFEEEGTGSAPMLTATYTSFTNYDKPKRWDDEQTRLFYRALRQCGADFTAMRQYFKGDRSQRQLKNKYKLELRRNPKLIDLALKRELRSALDISVFNVTKEDVEALPPPYPIGTVPPPPIPKVIEEKKKKRGAKKEEDLNEEDMEVVEEEDERPTRPDHFNKENDEDSGVPSAANWMKQLGDDGGDYENENEPASGSNLEDLFASEPTQDDEKNVGEEEFGMDESDMWFSPDKAGGDDVEEEAPSLGFSGLRKSKKKGKGRVKPKSKAKRPGLKKR